MSMHSSKEFDNVDDDKKKRGNKDKGKKKDKTQGYKMFSAPDDDNSEEEALMADTGKPTAVRLKKHKPSFKFTKKEKPVKIREKEEKKEKKDNKETKKLKWKKKKVDLKSSSSDKDSAEYQPIFGVPLTIAVQRSKCHDGIQLPVVVRECIDYITEFGLYCEGIYRISGVKSKVISLRDAYNRGASVYLHEHEPHIIASLLKTFLRDLPEPLLTSSRVTKFEQACTLKNVKQKMEEFQRLLSELPLPNRLLLGWIIVHMTHVIAKETVNKMSLQNVSIVLSPTLRISHRVLLVFFTYSNSEVRYVPPLKPVTSRWSLELPESPESLEEELRKQESLLMALHEQLIKVNDPAKEEQLWEVQRVVTQLKRKLKHMLKAKESPVMNEALRSPQAKGHTRAVSSVVDRAKAKMAQDGIFTHRRAMSHDSKLRDFPVIETAVVGDGFHEERAIDVPGVENQRSPEAASTSRNQPEEEEKEDDSKENKNDESTTTNNADSDVAVIPLAPPDASLAAESSRHSKGAATGGGAAKQPRRRPSPVPYQTLDEEPLSGATSTASLQSDVVAAEEPKVGTLPNLPVAEDIPVEETEDEKECRLLSEQLQQMVLQEEELVTIEHELRTKIMTEQDEIERLVQEIQELKELREDLYESSSDESDDDRDEEELKAQLAELVKENEQLEKANKELSRKNYVEREICANVKVQIRIIQQKQLETSVDSLL